MASTAYSTLPPRALGSVFTCTCTCTAFHVPSPRFFPPIDPGEFTVSPECPEAGGRKPQQSHRASKEGALMAKKAH